MFLKFLALIVAVCIQLMASETLLPLTEKEKQWIQKHPKVTYSEVNWKPLSIIEDNQMKGIMGDFLSLVSQRTGIEFEFVASKSWPHVLKQFKEKKIDLVPGVGSSPQEQNLGLISHRYAKYPMAIVTDQKYKFIQSLHDLKDKIIAVPKHYTSYNFIIKNYPEIQLKTTNSIEEALMLVKEGQADAFVGHIATSIYYISALNLVDLKISGRTKFEFEHHYLIQQESPLLLSIVNKAFDSITEEDRAKIYSHWIHATIENSIDYTLMWKVLAVVLIILLIIMARQRVLKKYTKELEKQKELYNVIFENASNGILIIDADTGRFIKCNHQIVEILQYQSKDDVLNLHPSELSPKFQPDGRRSDEKANEIMADTVRDGSKSFEWKHLRATGEEFWADITLTAMVIDGKDLIHVVWKDIDERKKADEVLKDLSERMELALIGNNDGLFDWDIVSNDVYYSSRWKEMIGYRDDELVNEFSTWESRVHPDDLADAFKAVELNLEGKKEYLENVHRMKHKEGHWVWISVRGKALRDETGVPIRVIGTHTDISQDREMQQQLAHQVQIIEQIHDAVISTDLTGVITSWNHGAQDLLGFTPQEAIGSSISIISSAKDFALIKSHMESIVTEEEYHASSKLIKKSKEEIFAELSLSVLKDDQGAPIGMIIFAQDITGRKVAEDKLHEQSKILDHQAHHDPLTGLPNRLLFSDRLQQGIEKAKRNDNKLALFFIDLDRFKEINDTLGHEVGDKVLLTVTKRLQDKIRNEDTFARLGGDEFTIIMENLKRSDDATLLAQKLLEVLAHPIHIDGHKLHISTSIGISLYPEDGTQASDLLKYADISMYKAKDEGRNNFQFYSRELTEAAVERVEMESSLRQALDKEEFMVFYQPQIDGRDGKLLGMEALIRWNHPSKGILTPGSFLPFAEDTGLILAIDLWVMQEAMEQVVKWRDEGFDPGRLSLNLSVKQFQNREFVFIVKQMLEATAMKYEWLEFEVTESQIMTNPQESIASLEQLSDLGISLAIDDFGTGYSSLSYLKKLPMDKLKIDQSFIEGLPYDEEDVTITKTILALSKSLNLEVVAEGVETIEQKTFLVENECFNIQGFFYSEAISAHEIQESFFIDQ